MCQATQLPCALSYVDICRPHILPKDTPPSLICCFPQQTLAPGEEYGGGRTPPPVFQLSFPTLWSLLLVLRVSVFLLMFGTAARGHILHAAGLARPHYAPSACTHGR